MLHIEWPYLLLGLLIGWMPPRLLMKPGCHYFTYEELRVVIFGRSGGRRRRWWKLPLVWIDPFRGFATAMLLKHAIGPGADATGGAGRTLITALPYLLIMIGMVVQSFGRSGEPEVVLPLGYVAGVIAGLVPAMIAVAAIVLGGLSILAFSAWPAGVFVAAAAEMALGYMFSMGKLQLGLVAMITLLPVLWAWMRGCRIVYPVRF